MPLVQRIRRGDSFGSALVHGQLRRGRRRFGSYVVHAGAVVVIIAIAVSSTMRTSHEARLSRGETATIGSYAATFTGAETVSEPHRESTIAHFRITKNGKLVTTLSPRMNQYQMMREPIGTPDVYSTLTGDLYLSIMNVDVGSQSVGVLMITTPMVAWIWISVILMGLGGLVALIPSRRVVVVQPESAAVVDDGVAASRA